MEHQVWQGQTGRQIRFYLLVGLAGLALLLVSWLVRRDAMSPLALAVHAIGMVVIAAWSGAGVFAARRRAQEMAAAEERARAAERAEALRREAQEAGVRAAQQVNARRTVSHGGMTITVHKARTGSPTSGNASNPS